jgi:hypothetical protein
MLGRIDMATYVDRVEKVGCSSETDQIGRRGIPILVGPAFFESDYLMATALTSLNVVWPSRTF